MDITLYHGSPKIIKKPVFGLGKKYNDFGLGFYTTKDIELAKEWACDEDHGGYVNQYILHAKDLKILNLLDKEYLPLNWLAILLDNRSVRMSSPIMIEAKEWIINNYLIDINKYDVIIGYRADDSYFSIVKDFVSNTISTYQLTKAFHYGNLGNQIVIKSKKAFQQLEFQRFIPAKKEIYYPLRNERANQANAKYFELVAEEGPDIHGVFMNDILRKGEYIDDLRIQ